jgi:hypothetical protein
MFTMSSFAEPARGRWLSLSDAHARELMHDDAAQPAQRSPGPLIWLLRSAGSCFRVARHEACAPIRLRLPRFRAPGVMDIGLERDWSQVLQCKHRQEEVMRLSYFKT